jgi:predicted peroxiredoxin
MENKEFVFIITNSYNAPEKAAAAFQLATNMLAFDAKIDFFLLNEGAFIARKGFVESVSWQKGFSPLKDLVKTVTEDFGCRIYVCASCADSYGMKKEDMIEAAEIKPGSYLGELLMSRQNVTF